MHSTLHIKTKDLITSGKYLEVSSLLIHNLIFCTLPAFKLTTSCFCNPLCYHSLIKPPSTNVVKIS